MQRTATFTIKSVQKILRRHLFQISVPTVCKQHTITLARNTSFRYLTIENPDACINTYIDSWLDFTKYTHLYSAYRNSNLSFIFRYIDKERTGFYVG